MDDAARALLLAAAGEAARGELGDLYRHGDAAERRGLLRSLHLLRLGDEATWLVEDALRSNDVTLVAAALGPYGVTRLDDRAFAHAVLKCVFMEIPLSGLEEILEERASPELGRMLARYVHERVAAGRDVPAGVWRWIDRYPPEEELRAIAAELEHPVAERRQAARRALAQRAARREAS